MHGCDFSGFHYEACNEADKKDFEKAIETIAVAFSSKWVFVHLFYNMYDHQIITFF